MTLFASHQWPVALTSGGVTLRPLRYRDVSEWNALRDRNRAWTGPWDATLPPGAYGVAAGFDAMVHDFNRQARQGRMLPWAVEYRPDVRSPGVLAGQMTISGIMYGAAQWAQAGYWVDYRWAGRGIIPVALALAGDYCFRTLRLHRFEVAIRPENAASLRVVDKLGFRYEGRRPRYLHVDGDWRDHDIFALNAEEIPEGFMARVTQHP